MLLVLVFLLWRMCLPCFCAGHCSCFYCSSSRSSPRCWSCCVYCWRFSSHPLEPCCLLLILVLLSILSLIALFDLVPVRVAHCVRLAVVSCPCSWLSMARVSSVWPLRANMHEQPGCRGACTLPCHTCRETTSATSIHREIRCIVSVCVWEPLHLSISRPSETLRLV